MGAPADLLIVSPRSQIVRFAVEHRIPTMYEFREFVSDGGLLSYGPNLMEMFRRSATYADRILNGAKPSDIPIERPTKFELVINLKTAKALGLTIPQSLLLRTDEVIHQ
jgi:putative ABC transport system substrate-binding protein